MSTEQDIKQVIVVRKDLKMRKGKMCAQVAHASMAVLLKSSKIDNNFGLILTMGLTVPMQRWLAGSFTKVVVGVDSLDELTVIENIAQEKHISHAKITDNGRTEFNGVPTVTCLALGPWYSTELDEITGKLKLL